MIERVRPILHERDGTPTHLIAVQRGGQAMRCFCDGSIRVVRKRVKYLPLSTILTCRVCNQSLKDWESFWLKQKELHPEEHK